ncbi:MAG: UvrD-helicase domain-containing protein, partial [Alphaproteobacteria bacterium]|nr:UvrD-helicase domain-containing protein [Alphaproteobacteria bacterium]
MMSTLKNLNPEQRLAVETTEGPVLVLSGAGTGKTSVLVARVAHIIREGLARPWEVIALTFTNKAANEMKRRITDIPVEDVWAGTFHSIALRILRRNAERAGLRSDFLIFGEDEQKAVLKTVMTNLGLDIKDYPLSDWVEKISSEKDKGLASQDAKRSPMLDKIYSAYNAELQRLNAVDFGDLILKTLELFVNAPDVLEKYQRQFKYVMVDEYQDTNAAQYQLVRMLAAGYGNICCVGDDDQSIYSWRGAEIKNILNFEQDFPGAIIIRLETNYRSTPSILGAANSLIRNNLGRLGKELRTAPDAAPGELIRIISPMSDFDEARIIANAILASNIAYNDIAVLIRAGALSRIFEEEFAKNGIPYRLVGATKFYDRAEIKDAIAYARLLVYPFDDLSFLRIISKPRRGFGDAAILRLRDLAAQNSYSLMRALGDLSLSGKQKASADEFLSAFDFDWASMSPSDAVTEL